MYNLTTTPVLTDWQKDILRRFFASPLTKPFFLTGGTALSAFYFAHRDSKDFDFFSMESFDMDRISSLLRTIAVEVNAAFEEKVTTQTYKEVYISHPSGWVQRVDLVREQPVHFGTIQTIDGVRVDTLENIGSNKITAMLSRLEPKDYIDLYIIVHQSAWSFEKLFELARKKDMGLSELHFSYSLENIEKITIWPKMLSPMNTDEIKSYYHTLARELIARVKPEG